MGRDVSVGAEAQTAPTPRRGSHVEAGYQTGTKGCLEETQRDLGVSCADDLCRGEGPFNKMVAQGVPPNPPDLFFFFFGCVWSSLLYVGFL